MAGTPVGFICRRRSGASLSRALRVSARQSRSPGDRLPWTAPARGEARANGHEVRTGVRASAARRCDRTPASPGARPTSAARRAAPADEQRRRRSVQETLIVLYRKIGSRSVGAISGGCPARHATACDLPCGCRRTLRGRRRGDRETFAQIRSGHLRIDIAQRSSLCQSHYRRCRLPTGRNDIDEIAGRVGARGRPSRRTASRARLAPRIPVDGAMTVFARKDILETRARRGRVSAGAAAVLPGRFTGSGRGHRRRAHASLSSRDVGCGKMACSALLGGPRGSSPPLALISRVNSAPTMWAPRSCRYSCRDHFTMPWSVSPAHRLCRCRRRGKRPTRM